MELGARRRRRKPETPKSSAVAATGCAPAGEGVGVVRPDVMGHTANILDDRLSALSQPGFKDISPDLQDFVENAAVPMHAVGADGTVVWANKAELELLGYSADEYIGHHIREFHADPKVLDDILSRLARNEELIEFEARLRCKNGAIREVAITSNVFWRDGKFIHTRCITRDIAEKRRAYELQARLAAIVESSDDAIISKDLNGIIQSWNRGAERLFGYTPEEAIGKHISLIGVPDRLEDFPNILGRISRGERVDHFETRRRAKDGRVINVSLTVSPVRDSNGTIIAASKIARDVTSQKRASETQARLAAIIESSDDAIISKDLDGIIQSWNRGAERIFGYTADEVIGQHISILAAPDRLDEIPIILDRIRRGERVEHYQTHRRAKDGRILTVSLTVSPVRDNSGNIIGISKIARDITDLERSERALREANEALTRSNADLQQFAYSASHDLQEPLRTVATYVSLLKRKFGGQLGPEADEYIQGSINSVHRMNQLLKDILAYTQASMMTEDPAEDDAGAALDDALANLKSAIEESGATITYTTLPSVKMHKTHLQQILQNLLGNAIRYRSAEPPRIHVAAERRGSDWLFSVRDNGIGIEAQYKEQIFGIFKRLHSVADYPGTGMGLAICERLVNRARGRIWVESELGNGSTFYFTVPV